MNKGDKMNDDSNSEGSITINLVKRKKGGVGFLVNNASPGYLAVSHVVKGGVAQETGFIETGDVILEVNGKTLENVPYVKALEILDKVPTGETVVLKIRARDGFQAYLETAFDREGVVRTVRTTRPKATSKGSTGMNGETQEANDSSKMEFVSNGGTEKEKGIPEKEENVVKETPSMNNDAVNKDHPDNESAAGSESTGVQKCPVTNAAAKPQQPKYVRLQNLIDGSFTTDTLHQKAIIVS